MALTTVPASLSATALTLTTAAQPNITSVGTLTGLTVSGNIAGTLTTAAQTNITSLGTLSSLTVTGTSTLGVVDASSFTDVITNTIYTASGNLDIDTVLTGRDVTFTQGSTALMTIKGDASGTTVAGNVGVKVPSLLAFRTNSNEGAIQIGKRGVIFADTGITTHLGNNTYITSANQRVAIENDYGSFYEQYQGKHTFYTTTQAETANSLQTFTTTLQMLQNGNVGIGESNPQQQLVVKNGTGDSQIKIQSGASNDAYLSFNNGTTLKHYFKQDNTGLFELYYYNGSTGVPRIVVKTDGNVGIGSNNPGANLVVQRTTQGINQYIYNTSSNQAYINFGNSTTGVYPQDFSSAGGLLVGVDSDETTIVWNGTASDLRFGTSGLGRATIKSNGHFHFFHDIEHNPNSVSGHRYIKLNRTSGYDGHLVFYQSMTPQWQQITDSSHHMNFYSYQSGAGFQIRFEAGGDLNVLDGNLKVANGHGVDFSATTEASGTSLSTGAEVLDDYEEGFWQPRPIGSVSGTSDYYVASQQLGSYIKIGNLVHLTWYLSVNDSSPTGYIQIANLPFAASGGGTSNNRITTGSCMWDGLPLVSGKNVIIPYMSHGAAYMQFYQSGDNTGWVQTPVDTTWSMIGGITYRTT